MTLSKRSYEKEIELPKKPNFVCRRLYGENICKYPNTKQSINESTLNLGRNGKRVILKFLKDNEKREKIIKEKEDFIYKYYYSRPPVDINPWRFSNHIIKEFSKSPVDKVHFFSHPLEPIPKYLNKPFRRPKENGDYFDRNIY